MPRIDSRTLPVRTGSGYPAPYAAAVDGRSSVRIGEAGGLTQFGASLVTLAPGAMSSLRHRHENEDEFLLVTDGELTLVEDGGEAVMHRGDCAAFPAGVPNGHHMVNRSAAPGTFVVIGTRAPSGVAHYSDVDLMVRVENGLASYTRRDSSAVEGG